MKKLHCNISVKLFLNPADWFKLGLNTGFFGFELRILLVGLAIEWWRDYDKTAPEISTHL
jgi:hypothetical protein